MLDYSNFTIFVIKHGFIFLNLNFRGAIILFCILFCHIQIRAQELTAIQLDRPDLTECPFITPLNFAQFESGLLMEHSKNSLSYTLPAMLCKYGINKTIELRMIVAAFPFVIKEEQLSNLQIGFKTKIFEEKGLIPHTSFLGHLSLSSGENKKVKPFYTAPQFRFLMQHTISKNISVGYNLGMEWDGINARAEKIYTLSSGIVLTNKISFFVEIFGDQNGTNSYHYIDGGFTYLINSNSMIDASFGKQVYGGLNYSFISCGYSFRFQIFKNKNLLESLNNRSKKLSIRKE